MSPILKVITYLFFMKKKSTKMSLNSNNVTDNVTYSVMHKMFRKLNILQTPEL